MGALWCSALATPCSFYSCGRTPPSVHSRSSHLLGPSAFRGRYATRYDENQADYYGALTAMDAQIGRIRSLLRARGVAQDTLLTYTADNGPEGQSIHGYHGQKAGDNPGSTNGLRGRKRDLTEGGIREPGLLEWPGMIKKNLHTLYPAATFDYKPTVRCSRIVPPENPIRFHPKLCGHRAASRAHFGWC